MLKMNLSASRYFSLSILLLGSIIFTSCDFFKKKESVIVLDNDQDLVALDLLPMYGSSPRYGSNKKSSEQIEADSLFLKNSDETQPSRAIACKDYIEFGWFYLNQGDTDNAMRRANQAWQLNPSEPEVYGLFAAILNAREDHEGAMEILNTGISIAPNNIKFYDIFLSEGIDYYRRTGDNTNIQYLMDIISKIPASNDSIAQYLEQIKIDASPYLNVE